MLYCRYLAGCHIGVGLTWYTWLEQGRDIGVSSTFLDNLARVLKLVGEQED
ncbi:TPA: helix-turn-helix domain-containing protein, partial [Klebsiella variicola subsp. variicola]